MTPRRRALTSVSATRDAGTGRSVAPSLRQRWLRPRSAGSAGASLETWVSLESTVVVVVVVVLRICQLQDDFST